MSYDLHLCRPKAGGDALALARALAAADAEDVNPGPVDPEAERRKRMLLAALRAVNPALEPFQFDYGEIARLQSVPEAEARRRWRHIELNGPDDGNGLQLTLHDDHASIAVPYWHAGEVARDVWNEIWSYVDVLRREAGYVVYDPQLDRLVDPIRRSGESAGLLRPWNQLHGPTCSARRCTTETLVEGVVRLSNKGMKLTSAESNKRSQLIPSVRQTRWR